MQTDTLTFGDFEKFERKIPISQAFINAGELKIIFTAIPQDTYDWFSVTSFKLIYPKLISGTESLLKGRSNTNLKVAENSSVFNISDKWDVARNGVEEGSFSSIVNQVYIHLRLGQKIGLEMHLRFMKLVLM